MHEVGGFEDRDRLDVVRHRKYTGQVTRDCGSLRTTAIAGVKSASDLRHGDLKATKVGTHHRVPLTEFERYSHELMQRMAEASATDIEAALFGE